MKTEQVNLRLERELVAALERVAEAQSLDRATIIRRWLEESLARWRVDEALDRYQAEEISLGRAVEESGLTHWDLIDLLRARGIPYPLRDRDLAERFQSLRGDAESHAFVEQRDSRRPRRGNDVTTTRSDRATLPDRPPRPGGVLLVGINAAPISVSAGHYYQGRLGQRLWRRLEEVGLLADPTPGAEDEAFVRAGHGLTDVVKRATKSAESIRNDELTAGADALREKVREWSPSLILFSFKKAAVAALGDSAVRPGRGPEIEGVPTFLLSGPYASRTDSMAVDAELRQLLERSQTATASGGSRTQRITATDLASGRVRLPREAKRFFPPERTTVEVILRGARVQSRYDPRTAPDKERSAVLSVQSETLRALVLEGERLSVSRGRGGLVRLD